MEIMKDIINECVEHFISKLEENILVEDFEYGKFQFVMYYREHLEIKYATYQYHDGSYSYSTLIEFSFYNKDEYPKRIWFWYDEEKKKDRNKYIELQNLKE